jgi:hypothetical protein
MSEKTLNRLKRKARNKELEKIKWNTRREKIEKERAQQAWLTLRKIMFTRTTLPYN